VTSVPTPKDQRPAQQGPGRASLQCLLASAEHVLIEHGLQDFTIARVAEESGVSAAMVYRRFAGKKELLAAVDADLQDRLNAAISGALNDSGTSLGEVLRGFTGALSEVLAGSGRVIPVLRGGRTSGAADQGLAITSVVQQRFLDVANRHRTGMRRGNPTAALKVVFHTVISAATYRATTTPQCLDGLTWQRWADEIADMMTAYLQTPEHSPPARR
jgi:AcrR family transcriptional regulator